MVGWFGLALKCSSFYEIMECIVIFCELSGYMFMGYHSVK